MTMPIMKRCRVSIAGMILFGVITAYAEAHHAQPETSVRLEYLEPLIVQLGSVLYAEHCASCHGQNLGGQADWH